MSEVNESIAFNETWWNDVQEGEPVTQDEIDEVKNLIAGYKLAVKALERIYNIRETLPLGAKERNLSRGLDTVEIVSGKALAEIKRLSGE